MFVDVKVKKGSSLFIGRDIGYPRQGCYQSLWRGNLFKRAPQNRTLLLPSVVSQHHFVYSQSSVGEQYLTACGDDDRKVFTTSPTAFSCTHVANLDGKFHQAEKSEPHSWAGVIGFMANRMTKVRLSNEVSGHVCIAELSIKGVGLYTNALSVYTYDRAFKRTRHFNLFRRWIGCGGERTTKIVFGHIPQKVKAKVVLIYEIQVPVPLQHIPNGVYRYQGMLDYPCFYYLSTKETPINLDLTIVLQPSNDNHPVLTPLKSPHI
ncbi:TPA: hypothetical protein RI748_002418 [Vibrio cholerae]|nr:hypothetical protein [Vibrio cholerae]